MNRSTTLLTAHVAFAFFALGSAHAEKTFDYPADEPYFSVTFPDDWNVDGEDQSLSASPEDETVAVELMALDAEEFDAAIDEAAKALAEEFGELEWTDPQEAKVNGMDVVLANAKGELEGETVHVNCCFFAPEKAETMFMLFFFAPSVALEKHGEALNSILQSITSEG